VRVGTTTHRNESSSTDNTIVGKTPCVHMFQYVTGRASGIFIGTHTLNFERVRTDDFAIWTLFVPAAIESADVRRIKIGTAKIQLSRSFWLASHERSFDAVFSLTVGAVRADFTGAIRCVHRAFWFAWRKGCHGHTVRLTH
jgi:hypothetical protein